MVGGNPQPLLNVTRFWLPKAGTGVGTLIELPGAPTNLAITSDVVVGSIRVLLLNWVVPAVSGHSAVGAYQVSIKSSNDNASETQLFDTLDPFIRLSINTGFLFHEFQVRAMNDLGFGPWSEPLTYTTPEVEDPDTVRPGPVRNLVVSPHDGSVTVTYERPADNAGIDNYEIERREPGSGPSTTFYGLAINDVSLLTFRGFDPTNGNAQSANNILQADMAAISGISFSDVAHIPGNSEAILMVGDVQPIPIGQTVSNGNYTFLALDGSGIGTIAQHLNLNLRSCCWDGAGNFYIVGTTNRVYVVNGSFNVRDFAIAPGAAVRGMDIWDDRLFVVARSTSNSGGVSYLYTYNLSGSQIGSRVALPGHPTTSTSHIGVAATETELHVTAGTGVRVYTHAGVFVRSYSLGFTARDITFVATGGGTTPATVWVPGTITALTSWNDDTVVNDTTYQYRVRAVGPGGEGDWTESSEVTPTAGAGPISDLPGQVSGVTSEVRVVSSRTVIRTTWPRATGGGAVNDYNIQRRVVTSTSPTIEATEWQPRDDLGLRLFYDDDEDLTEGILYQYRVQARGPSGEGDWSEPGNIIEFVPAPGTVLPGSPRNVSYQEGDQQLTVNWGIPIRGGTVDGYHVRHRSFDVNGNANQWLPVGAAGTDVGNVLTYPITNLVNGTDYNIQVRAYNTVGRGDWAPIEEQLIKVTPTAVVIPRPNVPRNFDETAGQNRVILDWDDPVGGGPFNDFELQRRTEIPGMQLGSWIDIPIGLINTHTDFNAVGGTAYRYRIRALGSGGRSGWVFGNVVTPTVPAPGRPFNVSADVVGTEIHFSWTAAPATGTVGASVSFDVQQREDGGNWITVSNDQTGTRYVIANPVDLTRYELRVLANGVSGLMSNYTSPELVIYTDPVTAPGPITNFDADPGNGQVELTWDNPVDDPVTDIDIERREGSVGNWSSATSLAITGERIAYTDLTVDNGTTYQYRIKADNLVGEGPWTAWFPAAGVTPNDAAPGIPRSVSGSSGDRQITWNWIRGGGGSVDDYSMELKIDPENDGTFGPDISLNARPTGTSYISMSLTNGYGYQLRVRANGPGGMSAWSPWSPTAVPEAPATRPGTVGTIVLTPNNDASVVIRWTHPASGGQVTGYEIEVQAGISLGTTWLPLTTVGVTERYDTDPWAFVGLNHWFRIRALGPGGEGDWFVSVLPVIPRRPPGKPPKPILVMQTTSVDGTLFARYSFQGLPPSDTGGATVSNYAIQVQYRLRSQPIDFPWTNQITVQQTSLSRSETTSVSEDSDWRARLLPFNVAGTGTWSDYSNSVLLDFP